MFKFAVTELKNRRSFIIVDRVTSQWIRHVIAVNRVTNLFKFPKTPLVA